MIRTVLFVTACVAAYAVAVSPRPAEGSPAGREDITEYLDGAPIGEGTRRKAIPAGTASIVARALCGEAAGQSDTEARAIAAVILNRAQWRSEGLLDVVFKSAQKGRTRVFAFTAMDPARADGDHVWGRGVKGSRCHRRMVALLGDVWQQGKIHDWNSYWHPAAMKPVGATPRWAKGLTAARIGDALFVRVGKGKWD